MMSVRTSSARTAVTAPTINIVRAESMRVSPIASSPKSCAARRQAGGSSPAPLPVKIIQCGGAGLKIAVHCTTRSPFQP
jgi:hypothetical protein